MPDISMCANDACPSKLMCYRYMAMPSEYRQAYALFTFEDDGCEDFLSISADKVHMMMKYHEEIRKSKTD